jgi:riboflavin-specific deaminase-like protein
MNLINGSCAAAFRADIFEDVQIALNRAENRFRHRDFPIVTLTYAQSIDGSIALPDGETLQLSNIESQRLTHRVRSLHDAILVGINTVLNDDPRLTVRLASGQNPQPVVVDSCLRFPLQARLLRDPCVPPIVAAGTAACSRKEAMLVDAGAQVLRVPETPSGLVDLTELMLRLKQMGFHSVMVEGGTRIITSMLSSGLVDQLLITIAPRLVGGMRAIDVLPESVRAGLSRLHNLHFASLEGDLVIRGDLETERSEAV